ncbi:hypothetical protein [Campylobacter gracilis]|uniref:Uncharacterized protein n=1 Tax=Campylobacter gracilis RM3268 TaxID=553220 RepID=C8PFX7_9BACT|nr:hypothetical protein [Campylobacter gracilis]EEV18015.1 hypothetical protein CAMGR0001_0770 [Campylobacter gracilis RM3268]UEB45137.1 hypothetical protein LK410_09100 [Campylobacter gracilis]
MQADFTKRNFKIYQKSSERLRANFIKFHEILNPPAPLIKFYKFKAKFERIMDESTTNQRR